MHSPNKCGHLFHELGTFFKDVLHVTCPSAQCHLILKFIGVYVVYICMYIL